MQELVLSAVQWPLHGALASTPLQPSPATVLITSTLLVALFARMFTLLGLPAPTQLTPFLVLPPITSTEVAALFAPT